MAAVGVFVVVAALAVGILYLAQRIEAARLARLAAAAASWGLQFSGGDPFDTLGQPFSLFSQGDGQQIKDVMWGPAPDGVGIRVFDFAYYVRHQTGKSSTREWHRFTCVLAELGTRWPHLVLQPESMWRGLRDALGFEDIQFESEEFNRKFKVNCTDRRFASALLDPRMMQFLLDGGSGIHLETGGSFVLIAVSRIQLEAYPQLMQFAQALRGHIAPVVRELFP